MFKIAHRGNLDGPDPTRENHPDYLKRALDEGFCIECDVWFDSKNNGNPAWYFGHDAPQYAFSDFGLTPENFLVNQRVFVHCKDLASLHALLPLDVNCFFHDTDAFTLTSKRHIWTFPGQALTPASICVMPERADYTVSQLRSCLGFCTDYVRQYDALICPHVSNETDANQDETNVSENPVALEDVDKVRIIREPAVKNEDVEPLEKEGLIESPRNYMAELQAFIHYYNSITRVFDSPPEIIAELRGQLDGFWKLIIEPGFILNQPNQVAFELIRLCPYFHMLSYLCDLNTRPYFDAAAGLPDNVIKLMLTYSPIQGTIIRAELFYDAEPIMVSAWVSSLARYTELFNAKRGVGDILAHIFANGITDKYLPYIGYPYFYTTYISGHSSRVAKKQVNKNIRAMYARHGVRVTNYPVKRMINGVEKYVLAVVANHEILGPGHPVFKYAKQHFDVFLKHFHLELYFTEQWMPTDNAEYMAHLGHYFGDRIYQFSITGDINLQDVARLNGYWNNRDALLAIPGMSRLLNNDYLGVYFLTMGISLESIWLSNLKLAPLQMSGLGHPVSSFGSCNNFYITSRDVECAWSLENSYSEIPVLLSGLAAKPVIPPKRPRTSIYPLHPATPIDILISWTFKKTNPAMMDCLKRIQDESERPVRYHFTVGPGAFLPCYKNVIEKIVAEYQFRDYTIYISNKPYDEYLAFKASCHLALDCYPYAGFTTIYENLTQGLPTVVLEGNEAVNRMPGTILREFGLTNDGCIASSHEEYIRFAKELINNEDTWTRVCGKIAAIDFDRQMSSAEADLDRWLGTFIRNFQ